MRNLDLTEQEFDLIQSVRNYKKSIVKSEYLKHCMVCDFEDLIENIEENENDF